LNERDDKKLLYHPKQSVVDVAAEGALDFMSKLNHRLPEELIESRVSRVLLGIDVVHLEKKGNSIRIWGNNRINPTDDTTAFETVKKAYFNHTFRKQRMLNVLNKNDWFYGFDTLLSKTDTELTISNSYFGNDVRKAFEDIGVTNKSNGGKKMSNENQETVPKTDEKVIYDLVSTYIREKLRNKYQLEWNNSFKNTPKEDEYNRMKSKVAREAFLAIRSRTETDFIDYFASTLCAFSHFLSEQDYESLAKALYKETDKIRTLTMLALSARG
jgi:CRISPR-associated protein Cmx8